MQGTILGGRYRLVRQVGEGGMGQVWQAHDGTLGRPVAVKVITVLSGDGSRGDEARSRFLREARITAGLQHPNIVTVHDLGETEGPDGTAPFLVMELLPGEGLDVVLRRRPVALVEAAEWGAQICDALAEAHRAGVLHRDIKPSNVQITPPGAAKVLDFGIARAADPYATKDRLTRTGFLLGTPPYMAPEQARGHPETRSDLYAVGCLLFEAITGRLPFQAPDPVSYITAHLTEVPPAPSAVAEGIPPTWDEVILTLLRKDPGERYTSAGEVADALRKAGRAPWQRPTLVEWRSTVEEPDHRRARDLQPLERDRERPTEPVRKKERREPARDAFTASIRDARPGEFPRPLGPRVRGFCVKLLVSAVALALWVVIAHQLDPQENWAPDGPDYFVFAAVVLGCAAWQYGSDKKAPHSRISCNAHHLTITQEVERDRQTRVAEFSVPWTSIDRIGIEGLGREAPLVVRFRADNGPTAEWLRRYGADRHPSGVGYVLCRPARAASGASPANDLISRLRTELSKYADSRHGR